MRGHVALVAAILAVTVAAPSSSRAQESSEIADACTSRGRRIASFAAHQHGWSLRDPSATRRLTLGRGTVWIVDENPACCRRVVRRRGSTRLELAGCSVRSEARTAHVGEVGSTRIALASSRPDLEPAVAGENMLRAAFRARAWSAFVLAAAAVPASEEQALTLAMHVHATFWHGLGVILSEEAVVAAASARDRPALVEALGRAWHLALGPVESRAVRTGDGFDVTIWSSRRVSATSELDPGGGPGAVLSEELRRTKLRIARDGSIVVLEVVASTGSVQRAIAR